MTRSRPAEPTPHDLEQLLGPAHPGFRSFIAGEPTLRPEWKYYGAKSGWALKLLDGRRNLCFLMPKEGHFTAGFIFGDRAVNAVLASAAVPQSVKDELGAARKYAEGRGVRVRVMGESELAVVRALLEIKRG